MATKPTPGGSDGTWDAELNAHLEVSLASDGKIKDGAEQTTDAAPGADKELVNKKYADALIAAIQDPTYSGGESHTFDGGLIIKMGVVVEAGTSNTVTFGTIFPGGIVVSFATTTKASAGGTVDISAQSANAMTVKLGGAVTGFHWLAIGY